MAFDFRSIIGIRYANNETPTSGVSDFQTARRILSNAEFLGMYANPIEFLPSQGAGVTVVPLVSYLIYHYGTVQTTAGGTVVLQYGNTPFGLGVQVGSPISMSAALINAATTSIGGMLVSGWALAPTDIAAATNTPIFVSNNTAAYLTGDGYIEVILLYITVSI